VKAWGTAPAAVHWELGVRSDGPPLLRLIGDAYQANGDPSEAADLSDTTVDPSDAVAATQPLATQRLATQRLRRAS
jgi:hypothetical protein